MGSRPEVSDGTGSNRAECHTIAHELIGGPFLSRAGELRTEGADTTKAALAQEALDNVPKCVEPERLDCDTGEAKSTAGDGDMCPVEK